MIVGGRYIRFLVLALFTATAAPGASSQSVNSGTSAPVVQSTRELRLSFTEKNWAPTNIELLQGHVFFQAKVNGQTVWALLDNGLDRTVIAASLARELRLSSNPGFAGTVVTPRGKLETTLIPGVSVDIPGQLSFKDDLLSVDLSTISDKIGRQIGLVLGAEVLSNSSYYIDTKNMRLYIRPSGKITLNKVVPRVPLDQGALVDVRINDLPLRLLIDLGFSGTVQLSDRAWRRVVPPGSVTSSGTGYDAGGRESAVTLSPPLRFQMGEIAATMPISTQRDDIPGADGWIGMGFFRHFNTLIDGPKGNLLLIPHVAGQTSYRFEYAN
jgi:hypothetical protein